MMRIVVAHPHASVRSALETPRGAADAPSFAWRVEVGSADPAAVRAAWRARRPDAVVVDERLAAELLEAARRGEEDAVAPESVLVVADTFSGEHVARCLAGGIGGYVWRFDDDVDVRHAVGQLGAGRRVLSRSVLSCILERASRGLSDARDEPPRLVALPSRERAVLELLGRGCSNREIADRLWISEAGVKSHVSRSMRRFGVKNRVQLAHLVWESRRPSDPDWAVGRSGAGLVGETVHEVRR